MSRIRLASCHPMPEPDADEALLVAALGRRGVSARVVDWRCSQEDWRDRVPTVLRSTWNYLHHLEEFSSWVDLVSSRSPLMNPAAIVRDNWHKSYLTRLEARGIPILPTVLLTAGTRVDLEALCAERGFDDVVLKPAVSAGSFGTLRVRPADRAVGQRHLDASLLARDMLVQRYAPAVETSGERALVWIDGEWTHSVRKSPRFSTDDECVSAALPIAADELELAEATLAPMRSELLYARVDVVRDEGGRPRVMELELIEPSLFLAQHAPALHRFADALAARFG